MFGLKRERTLCVGVVGLGLIGGSMAKALKKSSAKTMLKLMQTATEFV